MNSSSLGKSLEQILHHLLRVELSQVALPRLPDLEDLDKGVVIF